MDMNTFPVSYTFASRYGHNRAITRIGSHRYIVEGETHYMRGGADNAGNPFVDFEGGPFVVCGESLEYCVGEFPCIPHGEVIKRVKSLAPAAAASEMGYTDSALAKAFEKPHYAYVLVETL
jgi:hypothetical protein